ncbi:heavy-metal-associated domain-containing protein [Flavobacterium sp. TAB 87]|uniref:heavy-metal-associated domain-containing protein n=1 Tax=Flavobacterium sp. TAB 87 TaxID=1729581 RepID=UPI00076CE0EA|nr:heavy metal-associated domain-containing protein [Flavobacterium sp. TAB 87]KVV15687.1 Copper chaperone [Flavobacterium sp. TAB 87]
MKFSNIKFLTLTLLVVLTSFQSYAQINKAEIIATGLTCSMCSNAINKQLKSITEVDSVGTDLNTNTFTVYFKKNTVLQPKVLKNAVEKAGFFVGSMVVTMKTDPSKIQNNSVKTDAGTFIFIDAKNPITSTEASYQVLDKGFVTQKEYKKLAKTYAKKDTYNAENENDYHLKSVK